MSCKECNEYLTLSSGEIDDDASVIWCSFIWTILKDDSIHKIHGALILRFIPLEWRPWWINALNNIYPIIFGNITMDSPSPTFLDITKNTKNSTGISIHIFCKDYNLQQTIILYQQ